MRSLTLKLSLTFLIVSLTATLLVAGFAVWMTARQFNRFVDDQSREALVSQLSEYYQANGNWVGIAEAFPKLAQDAPYFDRGDIPPGEPPPVEPPPGGLEARPVALVDDQGNVLIGGLGFQENQQIPEDRYQKGEPIKVDGQEVGRLFLSRDFARPGGPATLFLSRVNRAFIYGALGAAVVAVLLGILLARSMTRPLKELTEATRAVAHGDLARQVPVRSRDELGELAASFNQMNAELARSRDLRRQMTADIAHDLRTPLSVILGHSEALSEGVLPPKTETFNVIHDEAQRLNRLVDDLRILSLAEAGELPLTKRPVLPKTLLERAANAHAPWAERQDISLELEVEETLPAVVADPDRMAQVLDNLLNNAIRYTPAGGRVILAAKSSQDCVRLVVQDSGPGIPEEELPNIFERFYKGDKSRQRLDEGGTGLGLAIAKSIVEAHGGQISAESQPGQGVTFNIDLPTSGV